MGTYELPRNVKGEGRILFIFTSKSLIYTMVAAGVGLIFYFIFSALNLTMVGIVCVAIFALIGFGIGSLKVPELSKFEFSKKTGGENIDDVIKRAIKFKTSGKKIYVYKEGKNND
ncbi:MAG: PrgI family protein [Clostridia bacterium]|nr:PrgI family protein [Clostridia bacterium]